MDERLHREVKEALAAWVVDACPAEETSRIAAHAESCPACATEVDRLRAVTDQLAVAAQTPPPPDLRDAVLSAALRVRTPNVVPANAPLADAYADQIDRLDRLLASLTPAQWNAPVARHGSVRQMVAHLAGNDAMLAADVGLPTITGAQTAAAQLHRQWRMQAQALARYTSSREALLRREVRLAGTRPARGPAHAALVQRGFETWIHADDIRTVTGSPAEPPRPHQLKLIADLGASLLPRALRAAGRSHRDHTARLVLTGAASGEWSIPLDPDTAPGPPAVTVRADMEDFCRLLANRHDPRTFPHQAEGDRALAADLLYVTATLGCD